MGRLARLATSRRVTAGLFVAFLGFFSVGLILPQRPLLAADEYRLFAEKWPLLAEWSAATGLDDVYRSALMKTVFAVLSLQILVYLGLNARRVLRSALRPPRVEPETLPEQRQVEIGDRDLEPLVTALAKSRYKVDRRIEAQVFAVKNRFSPAAGLLFHASLILLLGGAWIMKVSDFRGYVALAEGQTFLGDPGEYLRLSPEGIALEDLPAVRFTPMKIEPVFAESGLLRDIACQVELPTEAEPLRRRLGVNRPVTTGGADVMIMGFGLAPVISVHSISRGSQIDAVCVNLDVWSPHMPTDSFMLARPRTRVHARFFPDYLEGPDGPQTRSMVLADPVLELSLEPRDPEASPVVGRLRLGESMEIGDYRLKLEELRHWANFQISRQDGRILILGFMLMVGGAFFRLFFVRRWFSARLETGPDAATLIIGWRAEYFPIGFRREFESIMSRAIASEPNP